MKTILARTLLAAGFAFVATGISQAQTPPPAAPSKVDAARQAALTDKRGLVERNMQLTPEEAKKFWPIYDAYQVELDKIVKRQNRAVIDYVSQEATMTDANAKRIAKEVIEADADEQKLREKTLKKMLDTMPARKAVRYFQIENKLRTFTRNDMAEQIPLVK